MRLTFAAVAAGFLLFTEPAKARIRSSNLTLDSIYNEMHQQDGLQAGTSEPFMSSLLAWKGNSLLVEVTATGKGAETLLASTFEAYDFEVTACGTYTCSGWLPLKFFLDFSADDNVKAVRPSLRMTQQAVDTGNTRRRLAGSVLNEAVQSLRVDLVRHFDYTLTGKGLSIGILSDSFNTSRPPPLEQIRYEDDVRSNDLPADVTILTELDGEGTDQGRVMAQLIHDIVPGAKLFFRTSGLGVDDFVLGIQELADAGCDVIVDGVTFEYPLEPFFQVGRIAQAANNVAIEGVPYFTSAGDFAKQSWEGTFRGSGKLDTNECELHDFGHGATRQRVVINAEEVTVVFQWDDPFESVSGGDGATRNMDFRIYATEGELIDEDVEDNTGGDPVATIVLPAEVDRNEIVEFQFSLCTRDVAPPQMKWIAFGQTLDNAIGDIDFDTKSSTLFGQKNMPYTAAVGAAHFQDTPAFGTYPPQLASYSSRGGTPVFLDFSGARINRLLKQPRFVATDGNINTFFVFEQEECFLPNGCGFYFFGTNAAASNAAAVAILMLQTNPQLKPLEIYSILENTAIDMNTAGFDFDSGHGLIDALAAVKAAGFKVKGKGKGTGGKGKGKGFANPVASPHYSGKGGKGKGIGGKGKGIGGKGKGKGFANPVASPHYSPTGHHVGKGKGKGKGKGGF